MVVKQTNVCTVLPRTVRYRTVHIVKYYLYTVHKCRLANVFFVVIAFIIAVVVVAVFVVAAAIAVAAVVIVASHLPTSATWRKIGNTNDHTH